MHGFSFSFAIIFDILAAVHSNKKVSNRKGRSCKEVSATFLNAEKKMNISILLIHSDSFQFVIINMLVECNRLKVS